MIIKLRDRRKILNDVHRNAQGILVSVLCRGKIHAGINKGLLSHKKIPTKLFGGQGNQTNQRRNNSDKFCENWKETVKCAISKATQKLCQIGC